MYTQMEPTWIHNWSALGIPFIACVQLISCEYQSSTKNKYTYFYKYKDTSLNHVPNAQVCVYLTIYITNLQLQTTFPKLFVFLSTSRFTKAISLSITMKMSITSWPSNLCTVAGPCTSSCRSTSCPLNMQSQTCLEKN